VGGVFTSNEPVKIILVFGIIALFIFKSITPSVAVDTIKKPNMPTSNGKTLYVGGTGEGNYTMIQSAVDDASDGDTVFVYDEGSPYNENVEVDKSINLIGENRETTIITTSYSYLVIVSADWVNISGFTILSNKVYGFRVGIDLRANYTIIKGNTILNFSIGIAANGY